MYIRLCLKLFKLAWDRFFGYKLLFSLLLASSGHPNPHSKNGGIDNFPHIYIQYITWSVVTL